MNVARPALPVGVAEVEIGLERLIGHSLQPGSLRQKDQFRLIFRRVQFYLDKDAPALVSSSMWQETSTLWNKCVHVCLQHEN